MIQNYIHLEGESKHVFHFLLKLLQRHQEEVIELLLEDRYLVLRKLVLKDVFEMGQHVLHLQFLVLRLQSQQPQVDLREVQQHQVLGQYEDLDLLVFF